MGVATGSMKFVKYLLFFFNFLVFVTGLALVVIGALAVSKFSEFTEGLGQTYSSGPYVLIGIGVLLFLLGFFGCCGAIKENACMLKLYGLILIVLIIAEIAAGIAAAVLRGKVNEHISKIIDDSVDGYESQDWMKQFIDAVQKEFKCCGANGPADYTTKPQSCGDADKGCKELFINFMTKYMLLIAIGAFIVVILQILAVIAAFFLARHISYEEV